MLCIHLICKGDVCGEEAFYVPAAACRITHRLTMAGLSPMEGWLFLLKNLHTFASEPEGMDPRFKKVTNLASFHYWPEPTTKVSMTVIWQAKRKAARKVEQKE